MAEKQGMWKKFFKSKKIKKTIVYLCIAIVIFVSGALLPHLINSKQEIVDTRFLESKLVKASEMTTAKLKITCLSEFKDSGIAILNRSDFIMVYDANIRAGIDMKDVEISKKAVGEKKIIEVLIPSATIQDCNIDPKTIKYFDTHFALFNVDEKEDANKAQVLAKEKAKTEATKTGILKMADEQAETLIKGILENAIPEGYEINCKKK